MPVRVVIAEDHLQLQETMKHALEKTEEIQVVGCTADGCEVLPLVRLCRPDVLLLNMVLPQMDGCAVLEALAAVQAGHKPNVIALSSLNHDAFVAHVMDLGAQYFMVKPIDMEVLHRRVLEAAQAPAQPETQRPAGLSRPELHSSTERVTTMLLTLGMPPHLRGFRFVRDAALLAQKKPEWLCALTKGLYPVIARHHDTSVLSVERSIRHAIEVTWARGRIEAMDHIFGRRVCSLGEKPTNGEFIGLLTEVLDTGRTA